ncbi:hypothetical protein JCM11491_005038 [Sporobolomyces phaffii]
MTVDQRSTATANFPALSYALAVTDPASFVIQLRSALLSVGFFNLTEIEQVIPDWHSRWNEAFQASAAFFQLPVEEKNQIAMCNSRHFRGYAGTKEEVTAGLPDWREQIDFGPDAEQPALPYPPPPLAPIELSLYGPNLYPSKPAGFETAIRTYRAATTQIAEKLVHLIGQSLSPEPELFANLFLETEDRRDPPYARLKVVRYPPVEAGEKGFGVGAHRDGGGLTLLAQDESGGLQVQTWDGAWIDVPPVPHALVINVGQVLERMSAGSYPATTHRVLQTRRPTPRISIPFFFSPPLTTQLVPLRVEQLHEELRAYVEGTRRGEVVSEVGKGDLHAEVYGVSAWKGIKRSHKPVWEKYYRLYDFE